MNRNDYMREYNKRPQARKYQRDYHKRRYHTDPEYRKKQFDCWEKSQFKYIVCPILKRHAETLKDDPEHLSTEFILSLIGKEKNECENVGGVLI